MYIDICTFVQISMMCASLRQRMWTNAKVHQDMWGLAEGKELIRACVWSITQILCCLYAHIRCHQMCVYKCLAWKPGILQNTKDKPLNDPHCHGFNFSILFLAAVAQSLKSLRASVWEKLAFYVLSKDLKYCIVFHCDNLLRDGEVRDGTRGCLCWQVVQVEIMIS